MKCIYNTVYSEYIHNPNKHLNVHNHFYCVKYTSPEGEGHHRRCQYLQDKREQYVSAKLCNRIPPPVWSQANLDGNGIGVSEKARDDLRFSSSYTI